MAKNFEDGKYAYLDRLSTEQLEEFLRADIELPEDGDIDVLFHILEVMERREEGRLADKDKAWFEFQEYYNTPEGEGLSLYPCDPFENETDKTVFAKEIPSVSDVRLVRSHRLCRQSRVAVAILATILIGMVAVQAAGVNVFGGLARWSEETFHFASTSEKVHSGADQNTTRNPEQTAFYDEIKKAVKQCGITEELTPTWYPDGFEASDPEVLSSNLGDTVNCLFQSDEGVYFNILIKRYNSASDLALYKVEKDATLVENYNHGDKTFYIMSNLEKTTATWSDGSSLLMSISGNIPVEDVKAIIDSIGG